MALRTTASQPDGFEAVREHAVRSLDWRRRETTNLHLDARVLKPGTRILAHNQRIPVERETVMVFADDAPLANWAHPCRYLLYDPKEAVPYAEIAARFPPYLVREPKTWRAFHKPLDFIPRLPFPIRPRLLCPRRVPKGQRYAILFSGASNNRHTNDMEFLYRSLRHTYGFPAANITCLNYDGTINYSGGPKPVVAWPGDGTPYQMPVNGEGTKAALEAALDDVKAKLKPDDLLLIHTNNHGGWDGWGKAYLCCYSGPDYYQADFSAKLATLPRYRCLIVMMEQCHSGGFNAGIIASSTADHTSVSSACLEDRNSIGGAHFDPFARDWIAAMEGNDPYGAALAFNPDGDGDGRVEAKEAHDYADAIHDPYDTPVWSQSSAAARDCHLAQRYGWAWTWFCPWFHELLYPIWIRKPIPVFWEEFRKGVAPVLDEIEATMERDATTAREAIEKPLKAAIAKAFS